MGCAEPCSGASTWFVELWSFTCSSLPGGNPQDLGLFWCTFWLPPTLPLEKLKPGVPPSALGCSVQPLLPWEALGAAVLQQRRKRMESPWLCQCRDGCSAS